MEEDRERSQSLPKVVGPRKKKKRFFIVVRHKIIFRLNSSYSEDHSSSVDEYGKYS